MYVPVVDCFYNQIDDCDKDARECDFGPFANVDEGEVLRPAFNELVEAYKQYPDYMPCRNCDKMRGAIWFKWQKACTPLQWKDAYKNMKAFQKKHNKRFKLSTHANETLSLSQIRTLLDLWARQEDFIPDVIIVDYADILASDADCTHLNSRDQHNKNWQRLRSLSQTYHCLVVTATQSDSKSYEKKVRVLNLTHFSEDKRKFAHVTGMYGLNQDSEEKQIGLMRINELVVREDAFVDSNQVNVLQRLEMGRPYIGSF
jgi:hypothetical protein